ncbi:MAG: 1-acyl-sn-glycerol-3-phosphate acyltransferase [Eggerthellaceae bacterium]|nr:1-acyl-sn-glycerol-3-phosphate acyltransferase [Eggerthellaceae bacterium]
MNYTIVANLYRLPKILEMMHRIADRPDLYSEQESYDYVRYVISLMQKTGWIKTEAFGTENLPEEGGYVLYPNHQGKYDAYSIAAVHEKALTVVMDREMSYPPLVDEIIRVLRGKRLDITSARHAMEVINEIASEVSEGRRHIIFPEGAYSPEKKHQLWDFKPGCFKTATKAKAPIVPVALIDSYKPYNSWTITPVKTQVHFLKPLYPEEYEGMSTFQIAAIVKERIQEKLIELGRA